ncbi:hypothetical protein LIER_04858 [Lithospermum erythrorhizon]|uniref:Reverse transcriptase domain-containing protein n=1 Tax=Lithospermum erythrorhizon TaxID=34254 RepID=A0AAV3P072_LITER
MRNPSEEEIKEVVMSMKKNSMPGVDDFNSNFFQHCWQIIKADLVAAVQSFFRGEQLPRGVTSTALALIPKAESPRKWEQYKPINLCTVFNKIMTKVINCRLTKLLPRIISEEQGGFD